MKNIKVYQMPIYSKLKFKDFPKNQLCIDMEKWKYKLVYDDYRPYADDIDILENLFQELNDNHPWDFEGHSLSVSDIVFVDYKPYYCQGCGWKRIYAKVKSTDNYL